MLFYHLCDLQINAYPFLLNMEILENSPSLIRKSSNSYVMLQICRNPFYNILAKTLNLDRIHYHILLVFELVQTSLLHVLFLIVQIATMLSYIKMVILCCDV